MSSAAHARAGPGTQLALATLAFTVCFYAWSLLGPLSPDLQDALDLSDFQTSAMVAVPVLLGSLMRIPLGWLTDRDGGRRVFTALMAFTPLPLIALALWHDSLGTVLVFGLLLGFAGASFAVGVPFVNGWYAPERRGAALGLYGVGMGGSVLAGLTAPRIADRWGLSAPFWVATVLIVAMCAVFLALARDAPSPQRAGPAPGMFAALTIFRTSGRAWALTRAFVRTPLTRMLDASAAKARSIDQREIARFMGRDSFSFREQCWTRFGHTGPVGLPPRLREDNRHLVRALQRKWCELRLNGVKRS